MVIIVDSHVGTRVAEITVQERYLCYLFLLYKHLPDGWNQAVKYFQLIICTMWIQYYNDWPGPCTMHMGFLFAIMQDTVDSISLSNWKCLNLISLEFSWQFLRSSDGQPALYHMSFADWTWVHDCRYLYEVTLLEVVIAGTELLLQELPSILDGSAADKAIEQDSSLASMAPKVSKHRLAMV